VILSPRGVGILSGVQELARTPHWIVTLDEQARIVRAVRTSKPFADGEEIAQTMQMLKSKLSPDRAKLGLLVDLREGPFRNDDVFETTLAQYRVALFAGWAGVATLARTAVGKLQVTRLAREDGRGMTVFAEESEALAYLAHKLA
jgi:hypothetical protein